MKILILKPSSLGDVVQALPVLRLIKLHWPESEVYWWIDTNLAPLLEGDPDLAGLVHFHRRRWAAPPHWPEIVRTVRWLRRQHFDIVIDLQSLMRTGVFAWLANSKLAVGLDEAREGARGFYDIIVNRPSRMTHAVDWYLRVPPALGVPVHRNFDWIPSRTAAAQAIREKWKADQSRWIVLQPGARWLNKRWPAEHFAELVTLLAKEYREARFAILGGQEDRPLGEVIARTGGERCLDLTGKLSLSEMIEWIRLGDLMVTNDTGPMHVAAAMGKRVVGLFGPTEPRRTGPYGQLENVLQLNLPCVPCMTSRCHNQRPLECLRALTPATVFAAAQIRFAPCLSSPQA